MTTTLWIISGIATFTLLGGIVATIVVKIDKVPNWRKVSFVLLCLVGLLLFKLVIWGAYCHYKNSTAKANNTTSSGIQKVQPKEEYEWVWELPPGQYVRGLNRSGPMVAEIIKRDDSNLWINTPYLEYGKLEVARIRMSKISDKSWEGTWEQDNPEDHGRCELHEVSPGTWAGHMTGKEGASGLSPFCTLKRK